MNLIFFSNPARLFRPARLNNFQNVKILPKYIFVYMFFFWILKRKEIRKYSKAIVTNIYSKNGPLHEYAYTVAQGVPGSM